MTYALTLVLLFLHFKCLQTTHANLYIYIFNFSKKLDFFSLLKCSKVFGSFWDREENLPIERTTTRKQMAATAHPIHLDSQMNSKRNSEIPRIDLAKIDNVPYYIESKKLTYFISILETKIFIFMWINFFSIEELLKQFDVENYASEEVPVEDIFENGFLKILWI